MKKQGYMNVSPRISKLDFRRKGAFSVHLEDGRILIVPLSAFPSIEQLSPQEMKTWYVIDGVGFSFDACDEVFHLEDLFGTFASYRYSFQAPSPRKVAESDSPEFERPLKRK